MSLVIFNGSPRKKRSNSKLLIQHFVKGYHTIDKSAVSSFYIMDTSTEKASLKAFQEANIVLFFFPLYADAMPGIVKAFFEKIGELQGSKPQKIGFVVQSGFAESHHSVYLEHYLKKFASRLQITYLGTVIKGGVEGIRIMPEWMTKKLFLNFNKLGIYFAKKGVFSSEIKEELAKPYKKSFFSRFSFQIFKKLNLVDFYWNSQLKKHKAFDNRFDQPYVNLTNE